MRVSKDPDTRKQEILDAALELFLEKGFSKTAVSDIVRKINVAQGTFYYHFASKQEVMDAVIDRQITPLTQVLTSISHDAQLDPKVQLKRFLDTLFMAMNTHRHLIEQLKRPTNELMHVRFGEMMTSRILPTLRKIVDKGQKENCFDVDLAPETTEILLASLTHFTRIHGSELDKSRLDRLRQATELLFLRALGTKQK